MLLIIGALLIILWLIGFLGHIAGNLIHILLALALIAVIYHFLRGKSTS